MKIELHIHTIGFSYCGKLSVAEIVELYSKAGYDAIVLTNHFNTVSRQWFEKNGFELRFDENENDYLVYGMTEAMCQDYEKIFAMTPREFKTFADERGVLFYQAHPFRNGMTVTPPECLFGIEVLNTHPRHDSRNDIALAWAEKYDLHKIAGSDCHQTEDVGSSAILTDYPVKNMNDLVYVLKNDLYTLGVNTQ